MGIYIQNSQPFGLEDVMHGDSSRTFESNFWWATKENKVRVYVQIEDSMIILCTLLQVSDHLLFGVTVSTLNGSRSFPLVQWYTRRRSRRFYVC